uniref:BolA-like protein n=1 Tax=Palpitomonas bilix TaxID=652834 RepID=A0A7S3G3C6_9EUKA|mmetsp:Transcript_1872/g.3960  ORF Transcript_1872/g.3960 Transcript_1872/m.3960 type:complete len:110 (+) Transcript_1872:119-448(+)|eukprot:CAMPEP_0113912038 /NCGR_PEP_ID=MMETSP0780_2-20120614/28636_1 /TAXON_ID=652834 /ORGANISM="Palpitomonas bilix" /LENGTH=109 /DNA_ID=CAMNT_0000908815 /DNA_START=100 /DNA_END=429 /DNA_ORIENTATION=- /assembly_acc=CAM_ASM_000599
MLRARILSSIASRWPAQLAPARMYADSAVVTNEKTMADLLRENLTVKHLEVVDKSGGCGASFAVHVVADEFEGKKITEQHRLVNSILKSHIAQIHAISLKTQTPDKFLK